jgi:hypothetical protein
LGSECVEAVGEAVGLAGESFCLVARGSGLACFGFDAEGAQTSGEAVDEVAGLFGVAADCAGGFVDAGHERSPVVRV